MRGGIGGTSAADANYCRTTKSAVQTQAPGFPTNRPQFRPIPTQRKPGESMMARWVGLLSQAEIVAAALARAPTPHASVSPALHRCPLTNPEWTIRKATVEPVGLVWAK